MKANSFSVARLCAVMIAVSTMVTSLVRASTIAFVPPNDPTGAVFTTNSNDGYFDGRGDVLQMTSTTAIDSIGLWQNLTNVTLNYNIWQTLGTTGNVNVGATLLASGSALANTSGLQWIDFAITPLTLVAGNFYHIEFSFAGNSNQNFFYNNGNVPFTQGAFQLIDGTQNGGADNFVMPAIRINTVDASPVPLPLAVWPGLALFGVVAVRRKIAVA